MPDRPQTVFSLADGRPVSPASEIWQTPIPQQPLAPTEADHRDPIQPFRYRDYFETVDAFLRKDDFQAVRHGLEQQLADGAPEGGPERICIHAEKHGALYHPARVMVYAGSRSAAFVVNVAVSEEGKARCDTEYDRLQELSLLAQRFLPRVYAKREMPSQRFGAIKLFLGEWFDGYHEFHLSTDPASRRQALKLWDNKPAASFLGEGQTEDLYRQVAKILTTFYNPETLEEITHWHHAAGDFVVRLDRDRVDVKLISARDYASPYGTEGSAGTPAEDAEQVLQALLLFLLKMTIRIRLDRCDGVGQVLWAEEPSVLAAVDGFCQALSEKGKIPQLPAQLHYCFQYYLSQLTKADLDDLAKAVALRLDLSESEKPVVAKHLERHSNVLYSGLRQSLPIPTG